MTKFSITLLNKAGQLISLVIFWLLVALIVESSSSCISSPNSPLNTSEPICYARTSGNFSYYDAWKFCGSLCQKSYHDQGFTCPVLPNSPDQLEGFPTIPGEDITIFLNNRNTLKLNRGCIVAQLFADQPSWNNNQTKMQSCRDRVNTAICVMTNLGNASPSTTAAPDEKIPEIDGGILAYHRNIVETVNKSPNTTWKAMLNLAGLPDPKPVRGYMMRIKLAKLKKYLTLEGSTGRPITGDLSAKLRELINQQASLVSNTTEYIARLNIGEQSGQEVFPDEFDARLKWNKCSHMKQPTLNQGRCGSCYAVSTVAVISDRICTFSNQTVDVHLSVSEYLSCSKTKRGWRASCMGGFPIDVFKYWVENGLTTGGAYGSNEGCWPYEIDNDCGRPCSMKDYKLQVVPKCRSSCNNKYGKTYHEDKYFGKNVYNLIDPSNPDSHRFAERNMKWELMNRGPFVGFMLVPEDFLHYKSGIYQYITGELVYPHAVRVLGWGVENEVPYWLIANSWGRDWGDNGFFKILRGSDHLFFESIAVAGTPLV